MGKYDPLRDHLQSLAISAWQASFTDIERLIGSKLPSSAHKYDAWWSNESSKPASQRRAWKEAGWKTSELNLTAGKVRFVRS